MQQEKWVVTLKHDEVLPEYTKEHDRVMEMYKKRMGREDLKKILLESTPTDIGVYLDNLYQNCDFDEYERVLITTSMELEDEYSEEIVVEIYRKTLLIKSNVGRPKSFFEMTDEEFRNS